MTKVPSIALLVAVTCLLITLIGLTATSKAMMIFDESDHDTVCPEDYIKSVQARSDDQDAAPASIQKITDPDHPNFDPPSTCHKFFKDQM